MKKEIIISGFGGQGVMSIGKSLAEAGLAEGLNVTWAPSYGPEMRGGTANCSVVLSSRPVGSPVFTHPTELIAMNAPSIDKFGALVVPGGLVMINSSVVKERFERPDVQTLYIPCETLASELGSPKAANMVMLGAYAAATGALHPETIEAMIVHMFTGPKAKLVPLNLEAMRRGMACGKTA
ncbi:MAG: 2-oxoacid:ferredoxin oxidoreductase subunit gamma [Oscillibacter sp.]|nr:2-oxoacid:ferredoxin oxidoreductase subunit gamma [Oscillibacter sp.]